MKICVTGAAGRLGTEVVEVLHAAGHAVVAVDRSLPRVDARVARHVVDLLDYGRCYEWMAGAEALVHLANHTHARASAPQRVLSENTAMNGNVFQAAIDLGVRRIVFASSIQVISGIRDEGPPYTVPPPVYLPVDSDAPARPANSYAMSKHIGEQLLAHHVRLARCSGVALRYPGLLRPEWLGHPWHGGRNNMDSIFYLTFRDAARLTALCATADLPGFRVYFPAAAASGTGPPAAELIREFFPAVPLRRPLAEIDRLADCSRITAETGWVQPA